MKTYKLLTPGPLTTTKAVKEEMLFDRCTWDDEYKSITQKSERSSWHWPEPIQSCTPPC